MNYNQTHTVCHDYSINLLINSLVRIQLLTQFTYIGYDYIFVLQSCWPPYPLYTLYYHVPIRIAKISLSLSLPILISSVRLKQSILMPFDQLLTIVRLGNRYWVHRQQVPTEDLHLRCTTCPSYAKKTSTFVLVLFYKLLIKVSLHQL